MFLIYKCQISIYKYLTFIFVCIYKKEFHIIMKFLFIFHIYNKIKHYILEINADVSNSALQS